MALHNGWTRFKQRIAHRFQEPAYSDERQSPHNAYVEKILHLHELGESRWSLEAECSPEGYPASLILTIRVREGEHPHDGRWAFACTQGFTYENSDDGHQSYIDNTDLITVHTIEALRFFVQHERDNLEAQMETNGWSDEHRALLSSMISRLLDPRGLQRPELHGQTPWFGIPNGGLDSIHGDFLTRGLPGR